MDKIKAFFQNVIVKTIAWILLAVSSVVLIIGGATAETISGGIALIAGAVTAVAAIINFIASQIKK